MTNSEIDWSKAPEGATHYNTHNSIFYRSTSSAIAERWGEYDEEWGDSLFKKVELSGSPFIPRPVSPDQEISTEVEAASTEIKPPLGLTPKNIWEEQMQEQRRKDIHAAIQRYIEVGKDIPNDWLEELIELNNVLIEIETDFAEAIQSLPEATKTNVWIEWGKNEKPNISADAILELEYVDGDLRKGSAEDWTWNEDNDKIENHTVARYRVLYSGDEE